MSSVTRPAGRLPARVYWARRAVAVVGVVLLAVIGWTVARRVMSTGGNTPAAAATNDGGSPQVQSSHHRHHPHRHTTSPGVITDCSPDQVNMAISARDTTKGSSMTALLALTSLGTPACRVSITPDTMEVSITAAGGGDVWSSQDCPDMVPVMQTVIRQAKPRLYRFGWDGHQSVDGCAGRGLVAQPGRYDVNIAVIGGLPHSAEFSVTKS